MMPQKMNAAGFVRRLCARTLLLKGNIDFLRVCHVDEIDYLRCAHGKNVLSYFCCRHAPIRTAVADTVASASIRVDSCYRLAQRLRHRDVLAGHQPLR